MNPKQANYKYDDKERFCEACHAVCGSVPSRDGMALVETMIGRSI